jgi:hypothetical protein
MTNPNPYNKSTGSSPCLVGRTQIDPADLCALITDISANNLTTRGATPMHQYYGKLRVHDDAGYYGHLHVKWLSDSLNILDAGSELLKFTYGLRVHKGMGKILIVQLLYTHEVNPGEQYLYIDIQDSNLIRDQLRWFFTQHEEKEAANG